MTNEARDTESLFREARRIPDATGRARYLQKACAGDDALRARVEKLLAAEAKPGSSFRSTDETLEAPSRAGGGSPSATTLASSPLSEQPGSVIGRYKLLQQIGEGGFGVVYMAEQDKPVRRTVALKIIKLGMDTRQVIARFEAERQALAIMDHPHIAKVLDAGATDTGRPYFVMEMVKGMPITDYCDKHSVPVRERLGLFANVCGAVQHAHQKGIIHRDLKPGNILVTLNDGKPVPRVIDFGIAKATEQKLTERTMFTEYGQFMGTPAYMSPEQAEMSGLDIDTRTDIYSLGVVLYELLTGATPFDDRTLRSASIDEIRRIIREDEPSRPSTRISTVREELTSVAKSRGIEPKKLGTMLRGDLDWIAMKAMEKDRERRYESANELGMDIQRYLSGEAVVAAPPSMAYRLRKFVRRNKGTVTAGAVVAAALLVGAVGFAWQATIARAQRDLARARLDESETTVQFLDDMLAAVDPQLQGKDVTVRAVLDEAAKTLGSKFEARPLVAARLHATIGRTYMGLGVYDIADTNIREALVIRRRELGPDHQDTCRAVNELGFFLIKNGRHAESEEVLKKAVVHHERVFGRRHEITVRSIELLGGLYVSQVRFGEAEPLVKEVLERRLALLGEDHQETVSCMNTLAVLYADMSRFDEAEELFESAIEIHDRLTGPEHPLSLNLRADLAWMLYSATAQHKSVDPGRSRQRIERARALGEQVLEARTRVLGEEHQDTLTSMNNLASVYIELGMKEEAGVLRKKDLEIALRVLGEEHPDTITSLGNMGSLLRGQDKCAEALPFLERAIGNARKSLPPDSEGTALNLAWYGSCLGELGRFSEAEPPLLEARGIIGRTFGNEHPIARAMALDLIKVYQSWDKAEPGKGYDAKAAEWKKKRDTAGN